MKKRIVLVDDHTSIRQMLATLLSADERYEVVGEAATGVEALEVCAKTHPDLVVLDLRLPELTGQEVLRRLQARQSRARVLIYSGTKNGPLITQTLKCRPAGFVSKADDLAVLREGISAVAAGRGYFTSYVTGFLFDATSAAALSIELSPREREVLQMIAEGNSSKEISTRLYVTAKTVENHRAHLMAKLRLHGVASLTRYAISLGLIAAD
ncbi:MAG: hypothetical protein QOD99_1095 [Chthoniobacter sp.]|nr:hypothetical protein [Chthoniobacter sp.]